MECNQSLHTLTLIYIYTPVHLYIFTHPYIYIYLQHEKLCLIKYGIDIHVLLFKTNYSHLCFLYISDLQLFASETMEELTEINTFQARKPALCSTQH